VGTPDPGTMRVSDAERDEVATILRDAAGEGRLDLDELEERLERTYAARTYDDLTPIVADLPAGRRPAVAPGAVAPAGAEALELDQTMGNIVRRGQWRVPPRISIRNPGGNTTLDFRAAEFTSRVVDIHISASWGVATLIVPHGVTAEVDVATSWMGSVDNRVDEVARPDSPHLRLTGELKAGALRLYSRKPKKRR
jgi:hypothetical protein